MNIDSSSSRYFARRVAGLVAIALILTLGDSVCAQQVPDESFNPAIQNPAYEPGRGPLIMLDEAHFNFHTAEGRYKPFARLLERDGYVVKGSKTQFTIQALSAGKILVIANALAERNRNDWSLPAPTAFSKEEIAAVREWVEKGGSLLLVVDHMPMPGAAGELAAAFDVRFSNGYAVREKQQGGPLIFKRSEGSLAEHAITNGRRPDERVESIATFTGSAFQIPKSAQPLLTFGSDIVSVMPSVAGQLGPETPRVSVAGWCQGAALRFGKGRVAVFGEAAMFSAQLAGPNRQPMGMNAPAASQNPQFLLNVLHWLSGMMKD